LRAEAYQPEQEVGVRWKWERKLDNARVIVEEVNPKSIRVSLCHDVYVPTTAITRRAIF
jgi:hypothetical protein